MGLKVFKECCKNCLLSEDRIVSSKRAKEIINGCTIKQTYFVCHKASMEGREVVCKKFYDTFGHTSQMIRLAERLDVLEFVEQTESERLLSYKELNKKD